MRELNQSGWMSNRGRQIVASFFALDLKQDWRFGAHYFEQMLVDHDVRSNYGGWSACSGLGPGKVNFFNTLLQSKKFDPNGEYIKRWIPELKDVPAEHIHDIWNHKETFSKFVGKGAYPSPIPNKYIQSGGRKGH